MAQLAWAGVSVLPLDFASRNTVDLSHTVDTLLGSSSSGCQKPGRESLQGPVPGAPVFPPNSPSQAGPGRITGQRWPRVALSSLCSQVATFCPTELGAGWVLETLLLVPSLQRGP